MIVLVSDKPSTTIECLDQEMDILDSLIFKGVLSIETLDSVLGGPQQ